MAGVAANTARSGIGVARCRTGVPLPFFCDCQCPSVPGAQASPRMGGSETVAGSSDCRSSPGLAGGNAAVLSRPRRDDQTFRYREFFFLQQVNHRQPPVVTQSPAVSESHAFTGWPERPWGLRGELRSENAMIRPGNYPPSIGNSNVPHPERTGVMRLPAATRQHSREYGQQVVEIAAVAAPVRQSAALGPHQHPLTVDERKIAGQVPATIPFLSCHVFHRWGSRGSLGGAIIIGSRKFDAKPVSTHRTSGWRRSVPDNWHAIPSVRKKSSYAGGGNWGNYVENTAAGRDSGRLGPTMLVV